MRCSTNCDSYSFHKSANHLLVRSDERALELVKDMLRLENKYRLSNEYLSEYAKSQSDSWKTAVTVAIQQRTVHEVMDRGKEIGAYDSIESGIDFLRGAVGNYPEHLEELKQCANYVKYTQLCVRGGLRVGDTIDGTKFPLYEPFTLNKEYLSDYLKEKPLVIVASSYT